ncbi:MAG: SCO family protein [Bacteroidota bacterium]|nr:SCO family protein [Bacteroidota bacterium]
MNKKAILALLIALLIPLVSYLMLKSFSDKAVVMPRKLLLDSTSTRVEKGKEITDSFWHHTANITLVNQLGDKVSLYDKPGKITVMDFFFTRCPNPCPTLTRNMRKLQQSFSNYEEGRRVVDSSIVQFISFSVDPERDSVQALKAYANAYGVNPDNWWMLTGPKKKIYDFAFNELKIGLIDGHNVDTAFLHTPSFILLDKNYVVRGLYDGRDTVALGKLAKDIGLLMLEKDRSQKSEVFASIVALKWLWVVIVIMIIVFVYALTRKPGKVPKQNA